MGIVRIVIKRKKENVLETEKVLIVFPSWEVSGQGRLIGLPIMSFMVSPDDVTDLL
jgi:hypothetical protein